jgi:hypothetical protein
VTCSASSRMSVGGTTSFGGAPSSTTMYVASSQRRDERCAFDGSPPAYQHGITIDFGTRGAWSPLLGMAALRARSARTRRRAKWALGRLLGEDRHVITRTADEKDARASTARRSTPNQC